MTDYINVADTTPRVAYVATSGQTSFVVPFVFFAESDLVVTVNDVEKALTTHYTTDGAEAEAGGTITLVTGATLSDSVVIVRQIPYALDTHVPPSGPLDIPALNLQFSKLVGMIQQLDADNARSIQQPASDVVDLDTLPVAATRASKYLAFDVNGQVSLVASVSSAVSATAFILTLLDDTTAAAARTTLGVTDPGGTIALYLNQNFR